MVKKTKKMTRQKLRDIKQEINFWKDTRKMYPYPIIIELYNEIKRLQKDISFYHNIVDKYFDLVK